MIEQRFPNGRKWVVDANAVLKLRPGLDRARLERELRDMQTHFSRWVLTVSNGHALVRCAHQCDGVLIFDRGVRCVVCDKTTSAKNLSPAWFGLLPPIGLAGLGQIGGAIVAKPPPGHVVGKHESIGDYLLVPLVAVIPATFPNAPLAVHYFPTFRAIAGMPKEDVSHAFHMLPNHQMCLFAGGEWQPEMTCRETLQQRAYAHVIKLLNYANGKKSAFEIVS